MKQSHDTSSDVVVFKPEEVRSLDSFIESGAFEEAYKPYAELLIRRDGRLVVAASTGTDRDALITTYRDEHPGSKANQFHFLHGPRPLTKAVHAVEAIGQLPDEESLG